MIALAGCGGGGSTSGPAISVQPSDTAASVGNPATFTVTATGSDVSYQWQVSADGGTTWGDAAGATAASHTTAALLDADNGKRYRVVVSAAGASIVSSTVTLTVTAAPVAPAITVAPASVAVTAPASTVFGVTATGTALAYQWQRSTDGGASWAGIRGANAAGYDTGATTVAMSGDELRVVVANAAGSVTSPSATLTVRPAPAAPAFTTQPSGQSVTAGSAAVFTVAATGTPTPALQWQRSSDGGASFADIADATATTYNTGSTTLSQNGERYRAVATNDAGSAISDAAALAVNAAAQAPLITTQPAPQGVTTPATATFSAGASGVPTPGWQWQLSIDGGFAFTNIAGATAASYTTPATLPSDDGKRYRAVASNTAGTVNSAAVTLTVRAATPLAIDTSQSLPATDVNSAYGATLSATGGTPPYRWSFVGTPPVALSIDAASGVISGTAPAQAGTYSWPVQVVDSANPPQSNEATVELAVRSICDFGFGFLQVDGAPPTVEAKLCPQQAIPPGGANSMGAVNAVWLESNPPARVYEGLGVSFEFGSGRILSVTYSLNDPTRIWSYSCTVPAVPPDYPECTGVTLDPVAGTIMFRNTEVRSGTVQPFILNGLLRY
jgi:hypothetical protein